LLQHTTVEAEYLHYDHVLLIAYQAGTAAGRIEDRIRHLPAELLGEFQPHRLLALDAVGLLQGRGVEPPGGFPARADQLAAIVDQAVDLVEPRALQRDLVHVPLRRVVGAEAHRFDDRARTLGRQRR